MFDLYTWSTPNGRKVSIALEEFDLPYTVHAVNIGKDEQFEPEFLAISPNNKIPVIVDRANNRSVMESGAILVYLADTYDRFWGENRYQTLEWLMLQMASIGPMLGQTHHFLKFNPGKAPYAEERYAAETKRLYGVLNKRLGDSEYLAGSYSIADMATWPWIARYEWHGIDFPSYPDLLRWYKAIAARPAVQKGFDVPAIGAKIPLPSS